MTVSHDHQPFIVADLDDTLLHSAPTFEQRYLTDRSAHAIDMLHESHIPFVIATARPVSQGYDLARRLRADAVIYLNGALIDFDPATSTRESLSQNGSTGRDSIAIIGFDSAYASMICRTITQAMPSIHLGIVMDDVRYTNFDLTQIWSSQTWQYTDFTDIPAGIVDKIIVFPQEEQIHLLQTLIPDDLSVNISEGYMWMLMNPLASKQHALQLVCERWGRSMDDAIAFGDDLIDIDMLKASGTGIAVANAQPSVLAAADQVCPSNDDDGVAQWIERYVTQQDAS